MKVRFLSVILLFASAMPVAAQCPGPVAGTTAEELRNNRERLLCLQRELSEATSERQRQLEQDALNRRLRELELQRQMDRLDFDIPVYRPPSAGI